MWSWYCSLAVLSSIFPPIIGDQAIQADTIQIPARTRRPVRVRRNALQTGWPMLAISISCMTRTCGHALCSDAIYTRCV